MSYTTMWFLLSLHVYHWEVGVALDVAYCSMLNSYKRATGIKSCAPFDFSKYVVHNFKTLRRVLFKSYGKKLGYQDQQKTVYWMQKLHIRQLCYKVHTVLINTVTVFDVALRLQYIIPRLTSIILYCHSGVILCLFPLQVAGLQDVLNEELS